MRADGRLLCCPLPLVLVSHKQICGFVIQPVGGGCQLVDGADASEMTGARTLILVLTEKNEVKSFKLSSDGPEKIKSVRRQSGKGS